MIESFITDLEGAIPASLLSQHDSELTNRQVCDEVTLTITILHVNKETGYVVARFALDSPYWIDGHDAANGIWSIALPNYEMMKLLCTLLQSRFMKVILRREELLCDTSC